jgi:hypothetical protein
MGADVGTAQGQHKDKTQLEMRAHTVQEVAAAGGQKSALVLGIVPGGHPILPSASVWDGRLKGAEVRAVSWEDVAQISHPQLTDRCAARLAEPVPLVRTDVRRPAH